MSVTQISLSLVGSQIFLTSADVNNLRSKELCFPKASIR